MLFDKRKNNISTRQIDRLVESIRNILNDGTDINKEVARTAISTEGFGEQETMQLNSSVANVRGAIEMMCSDLNISVPNLNNSSDFGLESYQNHCVTPAQLDAATAAAILAGDIQGFLRNEIKPATSSNPYEHVVSYQPADSTMTRSSIFNLANISQEHYNEHSLKEATIYSVAYNMQASRQDEFCETFFPTLVITPDQVGFGIVISLIGVFDDFKHKLSGDRAEFIRKNIIHSVVDPTILKNELTRLTPIYRASENADKFVDSSLITPTNVDVEGRTYLTQPYKTGVELNVIGLCTPNDLVTPGIMDFTDTIDTGVILENIYFKFGNNIVKFNTSTLHTCNFTEIPQGMSMTMMLAFRPESLPLNKNTKQLDGSELTGDLATLKTGDYRIRLAAKLNGTLRLDIGTMELNPGAIRVALIRDANNEIVEKTDSSVSAMVTAIESGELIGYDIKAYRINNNRRTRGQLITTWDYTQKYNIYLKSPITAVTPINSSGDYNTGDLNALITATRIRASNCGVGKLIDTATRLSEYVDMRDEANECPDILGLGAFFIRPTYFYEAIDVNDSIDSLKSQERAADIQAVLINKIRDYVFRMYRDSEYKAAADVLSSGVGAMPTVIIGTDPVISRYLQISGDLRVIGLDFQCKIVTTLDIRVMGKIFIAFGTFGEDRNSSPNVLNFGNFLYSPEVTIQVPITRDNAISNELAVQPRFEHIVHCPILTVLQVSGIKNTLDKVPLAIVNTNTSASSTSYKATTDKTYQTGKVYFEKVGTNYVALSKAEAQAFFNAAGGTVAPDLYEVNA